MISYKDFYSMIEYSLRIREDYEDNEIGYSIHNQRLLEMFLQSEKDGYIVVTHLVEYPTHSFINFNITDEGQLILDMGRL